MMKVYSVTDVSAELDVDPRALRRYLRGNQSYHNAGMGGRYNFSEAEKKSLMIAYRRAAGTPKAVVHDADPGLLDDDPGVDPSLLTEKGLTPSLRAQRQEARALRQQRLTTRMKTVLTPRSDDVKVDLDA